MVCKPEIFCRKYIPENLNSVLLAIESSCTLSYVREKNATSLRALLAVDLVRRALSEVTTVPWPASCTGQECHQTSIPFPVENTIAILFFHQMCLASDMCAVVAFWLVFRALLQLRVQAPS